MGAKLYAGCVVVLTAATLVAQAVTYVAYEPTTTQGSDGLNTAVPVSESSDNLAFSSLAPAFSPHQLPVANIVDIAAEASIRKQLSGTEVENGISPDELKPETDEFRKNAHRSAIRTVDSQRSDTSTTSRLHVLNQPDASFLRQVSTFNIPTAVEGSVFGLPAMKKVAMAITDDLAIEWPDINPHQPSIASVTHSSLSEFKALLSPEVFRREHWQDTRFTNGLSFQKSAIQPFIVMLDPGHGGVDPGAIGHNGLLEKDLTLDIARRVRLFLTEHPDIDVKLTRHHDHGLSRLSRVQAIKRSEADMVISLHFNHLPQTDINLVESYYAGIKNIKQSLSAQRRSGSGKLKRTSGTTFDMDLGFTDGSARLAKTLQQHIYSEVSFDNASVHDAGVKQETFFVLTRSFTPSALIEISCLSHADEADKLASDEYRNRLAAALVDGIRNYHDSIQRVPLKKRGSLGA